MDKKISYRLLQIHSNWFHIFNKEWWILQINGLEILFWEAVVVLYIYNAVVVLYLYNAVVVLYLYNAVVVLYLYNAVVVLYLYNTFIALKIKLNISDIFWRDIYV